MILRVENLSVWKGEKKILDNVNLLAKSGNIVAILGPNGSGKTTLFRAIINDPDLKKEGKIYLDGEYIIDKPTEEIAKKIYMVFDSPPQFEYINTRVLLKNVLSEYDEEKVYKLMELLKLPKDLLERGVNYKLSAGEKKKFEILLMLLKNPNAILLDEIDSGLDADSILLVRDILKKEREKGKLILAITHVAKIFQGLYPDEVYIMKSGKAIHADINTLKEVIEHGYGNI
jgi:Fe-S cluster assembly ATP-binding protein